MIPLTKGSHPCIQGPLSSSSDAKSPSFEVRSTCTSTSNEVSRGLFDEVMDHSARSRSSTMQHESIPMVKRWKESLNRARGGGGMSPSTQGECTDQGQHSRGRAHEPMFCANQGLSYRQLRVGLHERFNHFFGSFFASFEYGLNSRLL